MNMDEYGTTFEDFHVLHAGQMEGLS